MAWDRPLPPTNLGFTGLEHCTVFLCRTYICCSQWLTFRNPFTSVDLCKRSPSTLKMLPTNLLHGLVALTACISPVLGGGFDGPDLNAASSASLRTAILNTHNFYRTKHHTANLVWNSSLASLIQPGTLPRRLARKEFL